MKRYNPIQKGRRELSRKDPSLDQFKRILVVTEGKKTEVNYLRRLKMELRAPSTSIEVTGDSDASPNKVLDFALEFLTDDDDFDYVYIVIDKDRHETYTGTIDRINQINNIKKYGDIKFKIISSVPCFELWLMLHISYSAKPYQALQPGGSPAEVLIADLKKLDPCFKKYDKSKCDYYDAISFGRDNAKNYAKRLIDASAESGEKIHHENPSTRMHELVKDIELLVNRKLQ